MFESRSLGTGAERAQSEKLNRLVRTGSRAWTGLLRGSAAEVRKVAQSSPNGFQELTGQLPCKALTGKDTC